MFNFLFFSFFDQLHYFLYHSLTPDPGGIAYSIGERAGEGAEVGGIEGRGGGEAVEARGAEAGSGRDLGKMCFNRLFL